MQAPMVTRLDACVSGAMASPVMRSRVPVLMGLRAVIRSVVLILGGEAEYAA